MKKTAFLAAFLALSLAGCAVPPESKISPEKTEIPPVVETEPESKTDIESEVAEETQEKTPPTTEVESDAESDVETDEVEEPEPSEESLPEIIFDESDTVFVMQVGGTDISLAALSHYLNNARRAYPTYPSEMLEEKALFEIKCDVATELLAAMHSVEMDEEYKKEYVEKVILKAIKTYNGVDNISFPEALSQFNMTDMFFRQLQENLALKALIYNKAFSPESGSSHATDEKILSYIHENYIRIKHILISTADLDDSGKQQAKRKAEEILSLAKGGESFEELVAIYSDDSMDPYVGYYLTRDETVPELEERGFEMAEGTISDIVESAYGYHIIKKYPLDDEYALSNKAFRENAQSDLCEKAFYDALYETANLLGVVYYDNYKTCVNNILS